MSGPKEALGGVASVYDSMGDRVPERAQQKAGSEPAYPFPVAHGNHAPRGLTKRELFAAMAMQGYISRGHGFFAESAVMCADILIAELEQTNGQ